MAVIKMSPFLRFIKEELKEEDVEGLKYILEGFTGKFSQASSDFAAYRIFKEGSHRS